MWNSQDHCCLLLWQMGQTLHNSPPFLPLSLYFSLVAPICCGSQLLSTVMLLYQACYPAKRGRAGRLGWWFFPAPSSSWEFWVGGKKIYNFLLGVTMSYDSLHIVKGWWDWLKFWQLKALCVENSCEAHNKQWEFAFQNFCSYAKWI